MAGAAILVRDFLERNPRLVHWCAQRVARRILPGFRGSLLESDRYQEIVAEFLCYVLEKADNYDPSRGAVTTWLAWQTRAVICKMAREAARNKKVCPGPACESDQFKFDILPAREIPQGDFLLAPILRKAVNRLPEHYSQAVQMVYLEGYTLAEAAKAVGMRKEAFKERVYAALRKLKECKSIQSLERGAA